MDFPVIYWWQATILGLIQGWTEFLPISSSGHLVLAEMWLGIPEVPLTFDLWLHGGTLLATIFYFWPQFRKLTLWDWFIVGVGTIPAAGLGVLLRPIMGEIKNDVPLLIVSFLMSAAFMFLSDTLLKFRDNPQFPLPRWWILSEKWSERWQEYWTDHPQPTWVQSLSVGIFQALALLPAVSRSGSTLFGGVVAGLPRKQAFQFSFILGTPAIAGALLVDTLDAWQAGQLANFPWQVALFGAVIAAASGFASLKLLEYVVKQAQLKVFGIYLLGVCLVLAVSVLL